MRETNRTDAAHRTRTLGYAKDNRLTDIHYGLEIDLPVLDVPDWNKPVLPLPQATAVHFDWDTYYPRLSAMTDPTGATQYRYQQIGAAGALRLQSIDAPGNNNTVQLSYDPLGRVVSQNVNGTGQTYAYDPLSRIIQTKNTQLGTFKYSYLGDTPQLTDALLSGSPIQRGYAYEPNTGDRRLSNILNPSAARSYTYQTAPENLIMGLTETAASQSKTWAYAYDAIDRLQTAARDDGAHYGYTLDVADNIQSITDPEGTWTYTHDNANKFDQAPYRYDALGNLIEDEAHTYQWDMENRLTGIGYKTEPQRYSEFRYDGQGRRIAAIETSGTSQTETRYTWCGDVICQTRDGNDKPTNYYYGEGSFRQTGASATVGEKRYYAKDHLGSVRDVLTQTGTQIASYDYDPYGSLINNPGTAPEFGYAGMQYHQPSGLYLTKYRAYDPRTGRWLSRDPIGEAGGLNLYGYVGGNPVSFVDPLGLDTAIALGGASDGNPFGHVAIAFTGKGVYSFGTSTAPGSSFTDYLGKQAEYRNTLVFIIESTPEQEAKMLEKAESYGGKVLPNPFADLLDAASDTCAVRTQDILEAGGVTATSGPWHTKHFVVSTAMYPSAFPGTTALIAAANAKGTVASPKGSAVPGILSDFNPR
ncbi:hypothetical protein AGMMS49960_21110 [Betaproteobacteria bacterium]|nr:hypothetical protein AGMMS49960_21110 [Betaproteobacteria bacterium]